MTLLNARAEGGNFQFGIQTDFRRIISDDDYLTDTSNYRLSNQSSYFNIQGIDAIKDVNKSNQPFSHVIKLRTSQLNKVSLPINLELLQNLPAWVKNSNSLSDLNIEKDNESTTVGILDILTGVYKGYQSKFADRPLFSTTINIQKD